MWLNLYALFHLILTTKLRGRKMLLLSLYREENRGSNGQNMLPKEAIKIVKTSQASPAT